MLMSTFGPKRSSRQVAIEDSHRSVLRRFPEDLRRAGALASVRAGGNAGHPSRIGAGEHDGRGAARDLTTSASADQNISMMVFIVLVPPLGEPPREVTVARGGAHLRL